MKRSFSVLILVACLLAMSCTGATVKRLGELQTLYGELTKKFGDNVNVRVNEGPSLLLTVTFINSPLNNKSQNERGRRAAETAQIVKTQYQRIQRVQEIRVVFVRQETRYLVVNYGEAFEVYGFDRNANPLPLPGAPDAPPPATGKNLPSVGYDGGSGTTHISAPTMFQIEGEPGGYGLTVLPHFKLPGDARRSKAPPPDKVSFNVASYSRKPRFAKPIPVAFIADGKPVMEATATFTGDDAQYCYLTVSYPVFRKLITATEVAIKLGAREYPLTPEQLEVLQKMDAYVLQ